MTGNRESLKAALAVLPKMYTAEQVREAMTAAGWLEYQCREVIWRLTQQTPAAQPVGAEVNGDLLYDSEQVTEDTGCEYCNRGIVVEKSFTGRLVHPLLDEYNRLSGFTTCTAQTPTPVPKKRAE